MAEAVHDAGVRQGLAVQAADALADVDQQALALGIAALDVGEHLVLIHRDLRQIGQHLAVGEAGGHGAGGGDPAGVPAHQLQHYHVDGQSGGVQSQLGGAESRVPGGGAKARAVVGDIQVVVHGLGNADDPDVQPLLLGKLVDLVAGVHGVVAAVIEEAVDVKFPQGLQHGGIVGLAQLAPAGADGGGGGVTQPGDGLRRHVGQVDQVPGQDALGAEAGGIDLIHLAGGAGGLYHALERAVDDRRGAAAVGDQNVLAHTQMPFFL